MIRSCGPSESITALLALNPASLGGEKLSDHAQAKTGRVRNFMILYCSFQSWDNHIDI
jgi:hypothetical protein